MDSKKICYFDTETTGTDPVKNGLIQVAMIIEIDDEVVTEQSWNVHPHAGDVIEDRALEVNKIDRETLKTYPEPSAVHREIAMVLGNHVDKFDRTDKFTPAGYNVRFDVDFLRQFFIKAGDQYFGSFFNYHMVDPMPLLFWLKFNGAISLPDYKLGTVCDHFGIELGDSAHDAIADIRATRRLIDVLNEKYFKEIAT